MDNLNTQQLVLLTLLVSFVTSIATGIITVSLLEQTPVPITQTINRVVEKTIERVIPPDPNSNNNDNRNVEITREKEVVTVIVKEEDLTVDAVEKNSKSLVRIYNVSGRDRVLSALGFVVNDSGLVLTDGQKIQNNLKYKIVYAQGEFDAEITFRQADTAYALLKPISNSQDTKFIPAVLGNSQNLKLAQTVISLSGSNTNTVSTGIIRGLYTESGPLSPDQSVPESGPAQNFRLIETTVDKNNVLAGSIILNLQGDIVGIKIGSNLTEQNDFRPINMLKDFLSSRQN
jgi:hypothetical protein